MFTILSILNINIKEYDVTSKFNDNTVSKVSIDLSKVKDFQFNIRYQENIQSKDVKSKYYLKTMIIFPLIHSKNTILNLSAIDNVEYKESVCEININTPGIAVKNVMKSLSFHASEESNEILEFNLFTKSVENQHSLLTFTTNYDKFVIKQSIFKEDIVFDSNSNENHKESKDNHDINYINLINSDLKLDKKNNNLPYQELSREIQQNTFSCIVDFTNPSRISFFKNTRNSLSDSKIPIKEIVIACVIAYICVPWIIVFIIKCVHPNRCYRAGFDCQFCYECNCCACCEWCDKLCDDCCIFYDMVSWCSSFWYKTCCSHCCSKEKCYNSKSCDCCGEFRWYLHSMENYDDHKYKQWCCARLNKYCFQCCKECDSDMLRCCWIYVFIQGIAFIALAPFFAISLCCHICYPCDDAEEQWENNTKSIIESEEYDQLTTRRKIDEIKNNKVSEVVAPVTESPINV